MMPGDDGWDDPVPLPQDDDGAAAYMRQPPAPAAAPPAAAPPTPAPSASPSTSPARPGRPGRNVLIAGGALLIVIVAIIVVVSGGGGSSGLSHGQLVTRANAICAVGGPKADSDEENGNFTAAASDIDSVSGKLKDLKAPSADAANWTAVIGDLDGASAALRAGNTATAQRVLANASAIFSQLGMATCASA
jgi:hypothetical protein